MSNLSRIEEDILREIGNIGAGRAAHNLSKFVHQEVSMSLPNLDNIDSIDQIISKIQENFNLQTNEFSLTHSLMKKDEDYLLFTLMPISSCRRLIELSLNEDASNDSVFERPLVRSMLKEVGKIILIAYVDALNKFVSINELPNPCEIHVGTSDELLKEYKSHINAHHESLIDQTDIVFINLSIWVLEEDISFYLGLIPLKDTIERYVKKLDLGR